TRRIDRHQLIVGRRGGGGAGVGGGDRARRGAHIDDHDLVAETVHFDKGMVGECVHASILPTIPAYRDATNKSPAGPCIVWYRVCSRRIFCWFRQGGDAGEKPMIPSRICV